MDTTCRVIIDIGDFMVDFGHLECDTWLPKNLSKKDGNLTRYGVTALNLHFQVDYISSVVTFKED